MLSFRVLQLHGMKLFSSAVKTIAAVPRSVSTASLSKDPDSLLVNWDQQKGAWSRYHYEWLRDNCTCPSCRHPDTGQRVLTTLEDWRPDVIQGDTTNERVEITWKDGHNSQYQHSWLLENSYYHKNIANFIANIKPAGTSQRSDMVLWDGEYFKSREPPSVEHEEYMNSDEGLLKMLQHFRKYGLCFINNAPATKEATGEAIQRIGPLRNSYYGSVWTMIAGSMAVNSVAYGYKCIPVHTDHVTLEEPPGLMALHCVEYNGEGGESMLLDGFKIAEYIRQDRPDYFAILSQVSIPYQLNYKDGTYEERKVIFPVNQSGEVTEVHLNHDDRQPLDIEAVDEICTASGCDESEAVSKFYEALRYLHNIVYGTQFVYEITLSPGNILAINNRRLFHGRKKFKGYRKLCGTVCNREEWESTLKLLENK